MMPKVKTRSTYCDFKSFEPFTGVTKKKYKLAGCYPPEVEAIPFFLLTTNKDLKSSCLVEITHLDWEHRDQRHLHEPKSFIDVRNVEVLTRKEINSKRNDASNGFPWVAHLQKEKFEELKKVGRGVHRTGFISMKKLKIISDALTEAQFAQGNLRRLGLS